MPIRAHVIWGWVGFFWIGGGIGGDLGGDYFVCLFVVVVVVANKRIGEIVVINMNSCF